MLGPPTRPCSRVNLGDGTVHLLFTECSCRGIPGARRGVAAVTPSTGEAASEEPRERSDVRAGMVVDAGRAELAPERAAHRCRFLGYVDEAQPAALGVGLAHQRADDVPRLGRQFPPGLARVPAEPAGQRLV